MANPSLMQNEWQYGLCECYRNPGICCKVGTGERDTDLVLNRAEDTGLVLI